MKSRILKIAFVMTVAMVGGINVFNAQKFETLSNVALANVEALADDNDDNWYCTGDDGVCLEDEKGVIKGKKHTIDEEGPKE